MVPKHTFLNDMKDRGGKVIAIGKIEDIFSKSGITHAIHTGSNKEGLELTLKAVKGELPLEDIAYEKGRKYIDKEIIFTNLVDTDMLYGHRNDAKGYGRAIEEIDTYVKPIIDAMDKTDLLIITADHGCDPCVEGTDHTREKVPAIFYSKIMEPEGNIDEIEGFDYIADFIRDWI
jgi:phosphopentomutase